MQEAIKGKEDFKETTLDAGCDPFRRASQTARGPAEVPTHPTFAKGLPRSLTLTLYSLVHGSWQMGHLHEMRRSL